MSETVEEKTESPVVEETVEEVKESPVVEETVEEVKESRQEQPTKTKTEDKWGIAHIFSSYNNYHSHY